MTISEVKNFQPEVLVIPIGSTEPHGPHLPYGTDTILASSVSAGAVIAANAKGAKVLRLPALPISNNVNFKEHPFACRIRVETLMAILRDLMEFALEEGVRKVVIINGHGGNTNTVRASLRQIYDEFQQDLFVCACDVGFNSGDVYATLFKDKSQHAGDYETSMVQYLAPHLVNAEARKPTDVGVPVISALHHNLLEWIKPWHLYMPEAYGGNPNDSSAEKGGKFYETCTERLSDFLLELSRSPWHPNFPYPPDSEPKEE